MDLTPLKLGLWQRLKEARLTVSLIVLTAALFLFIWLASPRLARIFPEDPLWSLDPNEWGDLFAGLFGPLAFVVLALGYASQREELRLQRQELELQRKETTRLADEAELQRKILEQQSRIAEIGSRLTEWDFVQDTIRQIASIVLFQHNMEVHRADPLFSMWREIPHYKIPQERWHQSWSDSKWRIHDADKIETLLKISQLYRRFVDRVPISGGLDQPYFATSMAAEIAMSVERLLIGYESNHEAWFETFNSHLDLRPRS
jgi:hypothetical protein